MKLITAIRMMGLILLCSLAVNVSAYDIAPEIEACIRKNAPESTAIQSVRLMSEGYMNEEKTLAAKVYWKYQPDKSSNLLAVFDEPDDILGSRLLFLEKKPENEIYLYMPALFKVRRITSDRISSSMYGMDFSYEDFQWLYNMLSTADSKQRPDAVIDGESMYAFAVSPSAGEASLYETIFSYFDKKSCVIRKVEFFEPGNKLRKVLLTEPDAIKEVAGPLVPHKFLMRDMKEDSETELTVLSVRVDPPIDDSLFDPAKLKEHRDIN